MSKFKDEVRKEDIPNQDTLDAIKEAKALDPNGKRFKTAVEVMADLLEDEFEGFPDGRLTASPDYEKRYDMRAAEVEAKKLGRPLTDEEFRKYLAKE